MRTFWLFLAALAATALPAASETTRFWRQQTFADFEQGTAEGVALRSDGRIFLAPRHREVADPNLKFVWTMVQGADGTLYLGGGSPAKVVAVSPEGKTSDLFESKELEVHALVADPESGTLYAATSPDGSLYELPPEGEPRLLFDPDAKYLWDLVRAPDGTLYLATGDKGQIFRIGPGDESEVFFTSEETHVRALALGPDGNLYAGTEPGGLVLRLSPDGDSFVLYETPRKEVTDLLFDHEGNLYVAAIGQKAAGPGVPRPAPGQPPAQLNSGAPGAHAAFSSGGAPRAVPSRMVPFLTAGGSDLFRIAPDGYPEELWSSEDELVYSLAFDADGRLLAGTGNEGKLLAIDSPTLYTHVVKSDSQQVTVLRRDPRTGQVYLGTANPGKLFALGPELASEGTFVSEVFDAELFSRWGRISWLVPQEAPEGSLQLYTRSGNTSDPQKNWSPWSAAYTDASGSRVTSPPARFLQWKAVLRSADPRAASLSGVSVAYLRRNVAPVVENIVIQEPGVAVRSAPQPPQQTQPVQLDLPSPPRRQARYGGGGQAPQQPGRGPQPPPQGVAEPGVRSVLWTADDANDDDLLYSVYYRGERETQWKLMAEDLTEQHYTWEAATLPDGAYRIKIAASDGPSNPPDLALGGENVSERFEVDNTPPRIDALTARPTSRIVEVRFRAHDSYSPLQKAEYSLDAGSWQMLFPESGTTDARAHDYRFTLENLEPGEHTVIVRVYDRFDNPVLAKVTFRVE